MSFNLFEISGFLGRPICLYEFIWGNDAYRYTSADRPITYGEDDLGEPIVWAPIAIKDSGFTQGVTTQDFVVELPRANPIVELFRSTPPSLSITLTCKRFHKDDPDEEAAVYWVGTVANVKVRDAIKAEILGNPISGTIRRTGLRLCWERSCPHSLYDEGCKVNKALFKTDTTVLALTGTTVQVGTTGAWPAERYAGGFMEWEATANGTIDRRAIERCVGDTLYLLGSTDRLEVGQDITIYLGCDLTPGTCSAVFNNLPNHGGFEYLAGKSPFDGNPVF
jgi:uncharacterized phage protein (TIGR02218 family)